jgi:hypothetical protein
VGSLLGGAAGVNLPSGSRWIVDYPGYFHRFLCSTMSYAHRYCTKPAFDAAAGRRPPTIRRRLPP